MDTYTYLSTKQLSELLPYDEKTIRNRLKGQRFGLKECIISAV